MLRACPIFRVTLLFTVLPICANALTNTASNLDVGTGESLTLNGVHFYTEEVNIHNGGVVYVKSHDGTGTTGTLVLIAPIISISDGSMVDGTAAGFPAAQGPGQGSGGSGDGNDGSGGGYGGTGGYGNLGGYAPGPTYGAEDTSEIEMGSGGGGNDGQAGSGGGAVTLICGTLDLGGSIHVDGEAASRWGGGGSGGGILILTEILEGSIGDLSARGGSAAVSSGGGGGGGRIKSCLDFGELTLEVPGGTHSQPNATDGAPGTISDVVDFSAYDDFVGFDAYEELSDFNGNGTPDAFEDFNGNGIPDAFEDFNGNGNPDAFEDFNGDDVPDLFEDNDNDDIPEGFVDANGNDLPDFFEGRYRLLSPSHPNATHWYNQTTFDVSWLPEKFSGADGWLWVLDDTSDTVVTLSNGQYEPLEVPSLQFSAQTPGSHWFHLGVINLLGNPDTDQQTDFKFNVNILPPTVSGTPHENQDLAYSSANVSLSWTNPDTSPGSMATHYVAFNQSPNYIPIKADNKTISQTKNYFGQSSGTHYFHVVSEDGVGNLTPAQHFRVNIETITGPPAGGPSGIDNPINLAPLDGAMDQTYAPVLSASPFNDPGSATATHLASHWQIWQATGTPDTPVWDSGSDGANLTSIQVPRDTLSGGITYDWRVRYQSSTRYWSDWSTPTSFTTEPPATPTPTNTATATLTPTSTDTSTNTPTFTNPSTETPTFTITLTPTITPTGRDTATPTLTFSHTPTPSETPTVTQTEEVAALDIRDIPDIREEERTDGRSLTSRLDLDDYAIDPNHRDSNGMPEPLLWEICEPPTVDVVSVSLQNELQVSLPTGDAGFEHEVAFCVSGDSPPEATLTEPVTIKTTQTLLGGPLVDEYSRRGNRTCALHHPVHMVFGGGRDHIHSACFRRIVSGSTRCRNPLRYR